jgi:hypothetical protein
MESGRIDNVASRPLHSRGDQVGGRCSEIISGCPIVRVGSVVTASKAVARTPWRVVSLARIRTSGARARAFVQLWYSITSDLRV